MFPWGLLQDISNVSPGTKYDLVDLISKGPMAPEIRKKFLEEYIKDLQKEAL